MRRKTLRTRMILSIWAVSALVFLTVIGFDFVRAEKTIRKGIEENAVNLSMHYGEKVENIFQEVYGTAQAIAMHIESTYEINSAWPKETLLYFMKKVTTSTPSFISDVCASFEPYAYDKDIKTFAPCYYRTYNDPENKIMYYDYGTDPNYNYFEKPYHKSCKEKLAPVWSDPYLEDNELLVCFSYPFFKNKELTGVSSVDISLDQLKDEIGNIKLLKTGYAFALSKKGLFISYPDRNKILQPASQIAPALSPYINKLADLGPNKSIFINTRDPIRGEKAWIVLTSIGKKGEFSGSMGFVYPVKEVLEKVYTLIKYKVWIVIAGLMILLVIIIAISSSISRPISNLAKDVTKIAHGNLDFRLPINAKCIEVQALQASFNKMSDDLKSYINNLKETTAAKERIESELSIARQIQASMLPRIFPAFPKRNEFDLFACMEPAKEVSGDLYDFFLIGDNKLCFLVADVSGKGVPASLFMVMVKTLLKNEALSGKYPDEVLYRVNNIIVPDNRECMFVTIFCALLDLNTGEVQFANAGHNPPLLFRQTDKNRGFQSIKINSNFVAGVDANQSFALEKLTLQPGDVIFLYTDGVTEAMNPQSKMFSEQQLRDVLTRLKDKNVEAMIKGVNAEITVFCSGNEQSDDITMFALKYFGTSH